MAPVWQAVAVASAGMHIKGMQGTCWSAEYHGAWLVIGLPGPGCTKEPECPSDLRADCWQRRS